MSQEMLSRRDIARGLGVVALAGATGVPSAGAQAAASDAPNPAAIDAAVKAAHDKYKALNEGKNADYIPALAKVPSKYFGIVLVTPDGRIYSAGDTDQRFSIQSIS